MFYYISPCLLNFYLVHYDMLVNVNVILYVT